MSSESKFLEEDQPNNLPLVIGGVVLVFFSALCIAYPLLSHFAPGDDSTDSPQARKSEESIDPRLNRLFSSVAAKPPQALGDDTKKVEIDPVWDPNDPKFKDQVGRTFSRVGSTPSAAYRPRGSSGVKRRSGKKARSKSKGGSKKTTTRGFKKR